MTGGFLGVSSLEPRDMDCPSNWTSAGEAEVRQSLTISQPPAETVSEWRTASVQLCHDSHRCMCFWQATSMVFSGTHGIPDYCSPLRLFRPEVTTGGQPHTTPMCLRIPFVACCRRLQQIRPLLPTYGSQEDPDCLLAAAAQCE